LVLVLVLVLCWVLVPFLVSVGSWQVLALAQMLVAGLVLILVPFLVLVPVVVLALIVALVVVWFWSRSRCWSSFWS
jgi:hypothetical protein